MHVNKTFNAKLVSKSDHHISIALGDVIVVGVYLEKDMEVDSILEIINNIIENESGSRFIFGEDSHIHPHADLFQIISELLILAHRKKVAELDGICIGNVDFCHY